ncbi:MAG: histidinol phosphate phosphatase domain-containing protein [Nitrospinota bacterium]
MIDLHMHTILSDGALIPAELARRAEVIGCRCIAITDHVDQHNVETVAEALARFCGEDGHSIKIIPGVEITHVHPSQIAGVAELARKNGAKLIVVHGETVTEPVEKGTNEAAIDAGADILAHPGLIAPETAKRAASSGVMLEISGRKGHAFANGHVARIALDAGAEMVFSSDAHAPSDMLGLEDALEIIAGAGLTEEQGRTVLKNNLKLAEKYIGSL